MGKVSTSVVYVAVMILTIVAVDILFFRHHTGERLLANIGIAMVYVAFYFRFFKK